MSRKNRALAVFLLGLAYITAVVIVAFSLPSLLALSVIILFAEYVFFNADRIWMLNAIQQVFSDAFRLTALEFILIFGVVYNVHSAHILPLAMLAVVSTLFRSVKVRMSQIIYANYEPKIAWRNLKVAKPRAAVKHNIFTESHTKELMFEILLVQFAILLTVITDNAIVIELVLCVVIAIRLVVIVYFLNAFRGLKRARISLASQEEHVRSALKRYAPKIVVYLSGANQSANVINVWTSILEDIGPKSMIVLHNRTHFEQIESDKLPIIYLPTTEALESYMPKTVRVALYPANSVSNVEMLNQRRIVDVFIGHGDSDKTASSNPIAKVYDQIWVAGPAGADRYLKQDIGIDPGKILEVGRPQLVDIKHASEMVDNEREHFSVLYAPTWEGISPESSYTSLRQGKELVEQLTKTPGIRVLFKPHPATGYRDQAYKELQYEIEHILHRAGSHHKVMGGLGGLYEAFNEADLLIADVSSVITDFLYSQKPYIVMNPRDMPITEFNEAYPSSGGAYILGSDLEGLESMIEDAQKDDIHREKRKEVSEYLLGPIDENPVERFEQALLEAIASEESKLTNTQQLEMIKNA